MTNVIQLVHQRVRSATTSYSDCRAITNIIRGFPSGGRCRSYPVRVTGMFGGLRGILGQGANNAQQSSGQTTSARNPGVFFVDDAPSWSELENIVKRQQKELNLPSPDLENGPANPASLRRMFGTTAEPRIKLYRDHAAWCPYCHKVVLQLEEKRIPYVIEKINMRCYGDKPREFLAKVPSGLLPVLEIDGRIVTESAVIQTLIEDLYPENPLLPAEGSPQRAEATQLMRLERQLFGDWLQWLCNSWGHESNRSRFIKTMDVVESELGAREGPYFLDDFSLVDVVFAPFLERIAASIAYYKGFAVRGQGRWPNLERWFAAMETRDPYLAFRSDYYTHCHDLPPQLGGCISVPEATAVAAAIDGTDGRSWHLPLEPLTATSLEPYGPGEDGPRDRLRAALKLTSNHAAVTKFALRGPGQRGPRPVSAPLSDPTAIPALDYTASTDAVLRHVARALLEGEGSASIRTAARDGDRMMSGEGVIVALEYLRDRVGVPRDMPLPAARQLRAHLNWAIDCLSTGK